MVLKSQISATHEDLLLLSKVMFVCVDCFLGWMAAIVFVGLDGTHVYVNWLLLASLSNGFFIPMKI